MKKRWMLMVVIFVLILSACGGGTQKIIEDGPLPLETAIALTVAAEIGADVADSAGDAAQASAVATDTPVLAIATDTPVPTDTPIPSDTPAPTDTADPGVCNLAGYIEDVTIPDDTDVNAGQNFTKKWRLINNGTCVWTTDYDLIFDSGAQMGGPASKALSDHAVDPGESVVVEVPLVAPGAAGTHRGNWKLRSDSGESFGLSGGIAFWVQINVLPAAVPDPPTNTPEPQADLIINLFELSPVTPVKGNVVQVKVQVYNQGNKAAGAFVVEWYPGENYPSPGCIWNIASMAAHGGRVLTCNYAGYPSSYGNIVTKAIADRADAISESDEGNNSASMAISVDP